MTPRVVMKNVQKRFGDVQAIDDVDFYLESAEVHALLGENGAGKTSLMNVLSGLYLADSGDIEIDGKPVLINNPKDAIENGIGMVHQHFELIPQFTVIENIIIGKEGKDPIINFDLHRKKIKELMELYGLDVDLDTKVKYLAVGIQQKVEILKALYREARILILDEPTTMLTPQEVEALFSVIKTLVKNGMSVVFITHKIREVIAVSDRITIMRRGKVVKTVSCGGITEKKCVELMMENPSSVDFEMTSTRLVIEKTQDDLILELNEMSVQDAYGNLSAKKINLKGYRGEIIGLVGVAGNGQREVAEAIYGLRPVANGKIIFQNNNFTEASILDRLKSGVSIIPEDRVGQGILPNHSVADTLVLGPHNFIFNNSILYDNKKVNLIAKDAISDFQIKTPSERTTTSLLSGGNIQKVITARSFLLMELCGRNLLIAFNPTRGLDFKSTSFVRDKLFETRNNKGCVILISEDLDESLYLCDRIYVMYKGAIVGEFSRENFDAYQIGALMTGLNEGKPYDN